VCSQAMDKRKPDFRASLFLVDAAAGQGARAFY